MACVKDKPVDPVKTIDPASVANPGVYVVCEGSLGNGDGTLYYYNQKTDSVTGDLYAGINDKAKLGDVFQSITRIDDKLFLCINNSDKVIVLSRETKKQLGVINIAKPRYILPVSDGKAYVSTLFSNKVYIIDTKNLQVKGTIDMPYQNPEGMTLYNGKAYICPWDTACRNIYTVDIATDKITQTIPVTGAAPQEALVDKNGKLWVLSGNVYKNKQGAITVLDDKGQTIRSFSFAPKADAIKPVFNKAKDIFYFIEVNYNGGTENNGIYKMNIDDVALPATAFITAKTFQYFWALGVDPATDDIYVGDPMGFTQKGNVAVYNANGNQAKTFNVGLGPGHFLFD